MSEKELDTMVRICTPRDEGELLAARSILEGEGIPYYVQNEHFGSLIPGPRIPMLNARRILVAEADAARARELLKETLGLPIEGETDG